jgi:hypothetical protein
MAFTITLSLRRGSEREKTGNEGGVMRDSLFLGGGGENKHFWL